MSSQRTFSIIKPDAIRKGYAGSILAEFDKAGFQIVGIKKLFLSKSQAEGFYYLRDNKWGGQNPFTVLPTVVNGAVVNVPIKPEDRRHQYGRHDRLGHRGALWR